MAKVLLLFASSDEPESKRLRDLLQAELGTGYDLTTIKAILAEDGNPNDELSSSSCVLLISTKQSIERFLKQREAEKEKEKEGESPVVQDGDLFAQVIENKSYASKMILVLLGSAGSDDSVPDSLIFDRNKVFVIEENCDNKSSVLDQIVDTIKGTVSSKVNDKGVKKEKKKKNCSQM